MRGRLSVSRKSSTSRILRPVRVSAVSLTVPSKSSNTTTPLSVARIGVLNPSHSATRVLALTFSPSRTSRLAP